MRHIVPSLLVRALRYPRNALAFFQNATSHMLCDTEDGGLHSNAFDYVDA